MSRYTIPLIASLGFLLSGASCAPPPVEGTVYRNPRDTAQPRREEPSPSIVQPAVYQTVSATSSTSRGSGPPPSPLFYAIDADGNHVLSTEELQLAGESLLQLDRNEDGCLTVSELSNWATKIDSPPAFPPGSGDNRNRRGPGMAPNNKPRRFRQFGGPALRNRLASGAANDESSLDDTPVQEELSENNSPPPSDLPEDIPIAPPVSPTSE